MKKITKLLLASSLTGLMNFGAFGVEIDKDKSVLNWKGTKVTGEHVGELKFKSGNVELEDGNIKGGEFVVDLNSLTVTDLEGDWAKKFIAHMKSGDFFEIKKYPTSRLKIKSVEGKTITGDLTIKDKTHPIRFEYDKNGKAYVGSFKFDRTKYGMIYNSGNFFKDLGDKLIHNDVLVNFKFVPKK